MKYTRYETMIKNYSRSEIIARIDELWLAVNTLQDVINGDGVMSNDEFIDASLDRYFSELEFLYKRLSNLEGAH